MYTITLSNSAGPLEARSAATPEDAATVVVELVQFVGSLYSGDSITIQGEEHDD
jgi:hypothetical protein